MTPTSRPDPHLENVLRRMPDAPAARKKVTSRPGWYRANVEVTRRVYVDRGWFNGLRNFERRKVRAWAVARSVKTAVLCGMSAAEIYGLPILNRNQYENVELCLPERRRPPSRRKWRDHTVYRDKYLAQADIAMVNGVYVTTIPRTYVDILLYHGELEALVFIDGALHERRTTRAELYRYLASRRGQWGIRRARNLLDDATGLAESPYETVARWLLRGVEKQLGITEIVPQAWFSTRSRQGKLQRRRVDLLVNGFLVIEIDGLIKYDERFLQERGVTYRQVMEDERHRERQIQNQGYQVLRLAPGEVWRDLIAKVTEIMKQNPQRVSPKKHFLPWAA